MKKGLTILLVIVSSYMVFVKCEEALIEGQEEILLFAYKDLVIAGAEIVFKTNYKFEYISLSLFGEMHYKGSYQIVNDTITLKYDFQKPRNAAEKAIIEGDRLYLLYQGDSTKSRFLIDDSYLTNLPLFKSK